MTLSRHSPFPATSQRVHRREIPFPSSATATGRYRVKSRGLTVQMQLKIAHLVFMGAQNRL
jgi:hypothetical protein